jgi:hypothetical protein
VIALAVNEPHWFDVANMVVVMRIIVVLVVTMVTVAAAGMATTG